MRLPTKSPFVHIRFSDEAQVLFHGVGRSKAAWTSMNVIANQAAGMAKNASNLDGPAEITTLYYSSGIVCSIGTRRSYGVSDADATRISREVSAMMAAGGAEHSAPGMSREDAE